MERESRESSYSHVCVQRKQKLVAKAVAESQVRQIKHDSLCNWLTISCSRKNLVLYRARVSAYSICVTFLSLL